MTHGLECGGMAAEFELPVGNQLIGEGAQSSSRNESWIEVAHGSGRGVPRIGEPGLSSLLAFSVHSLERRVWKVDLAAYFHPPWQRLAQPQGNGPDRPHVGCYVVAACAVATRGAADEPAVFISERDAQPVDLHFGYVGDRLLMGSQRA